jgi:hypothetical protein
VPSLSDLEKFFFLDSFDRNVIAQSRADSHRLGVAVQIGTVRYRGLFLEDPLAVPWPVVDYLAEQLGIGDASQVKKYAERVGCENPDTASGLRLSAPSMRHAGIG